jgi:two-component system sensor histidine kinase UhpB
MMRQQTAEANPGGGLSWQRPVYSPSDAKAQVLRRLFAGFAVIIALLGFDAFVGFFGAQTVRDSLSSLVNQQTAMVANMNDLQKAQSDLRSVEYRLLAQPGAAGRAASEDVIAQVESRLAKVFARIRPTDPDIALWRELEATSSALTQQVRRAMLDSSSSKLNLALLAAHDALSAEAEKLVESSRTRTEAARRHIDEATSRQSIEDRVLLAGCLLVSCLFLATSTRVYYRLSQQSEELNQVSWQLLERQELLAQRLSRDLHDELGQSLTALKTNFSRHAAAGCVDPSWMQDCTDLLKGSIRSAHEISQLLRPTLLDDFGLDSALSWLCEKLEERNGIRVNYHSDYHWRLDEQAETHVFRIAQEALTNVARHSEASGVEVFFSRQHGVVRLKISDNGVGLKPRPKGALPSFGLTGMKARVRSLDGEMRINSAPGQGVLIEVSFPAKPTL